MWNECETWMWRHYDQILEFVVDGASLEDRIREFVQDNPPIHESMEASESAVNGGSRSAGRWHIAEGDRRRDREARSNDWAISTGTPSASSTGWSTFLLALPRRRNVLFPTKSPVSGPTIWATVRSLKTFQAHKIQGFDCGRCSFHQNAQNRSKMKP
jgi:hypothetical protein